MNKRRIPNSRTMEQMRKEFNERVNILSPEELKRQKVLDRMTKARAARKNV